MKTLNVVLVLLLIAGFVTGKQVVDLPHLNNPNPAYFPIVVEKDRIYITDGVTIYIYQAKDYKLISVFGKKGEGPEEFKGYDNGCVMTSLTPDHIVIDSWGKLSFYSKDGVFRGELKMNVSAGYVYRPFGDKYTAYYTDITNKNRVMGVLYLYDSQFNKIKELARYDEWVYQQKMNPYTYRKPLPIVYDDKLFVNDYVDGTINVFDRDGKLLYTINYNFKKVEIKESDKEKTIRLYRTDPRIKAIFRTPEAVLKRLRFPGYFPVMKQYNISDGKIYVLTYVQKDGKDELIVLDLKGKFLERKMIEFAHTTFIEPSSYTIWGGKIYQLVENEEKEIWQLQVTDIK